MNEVEQLLAQGEKIAAVKWYHDTHDCSLAEAKKVVDAIEQEQQGAALVISDSNANSPDASLKELVQQNRKIEAIKLYSDLSGVGLKEAKDYVDALAGTVSPMPTDTPGETAYRENLYAGPEIESKRGGKWIAVVLFAALAALALILLRTFM